ncbi:MAG: DUF4102 domain-containing protein [Clostridia bacterium]|nr:DUF4102 domain-containing protein [Clostridia bacterium]
MTLTEEIINKHPKGTRKVYSDRNGLYLDIKTSGTASWMLRKMVDGKRNAIILGYYPEMNIDEARRIASVETMKMGNEVNKQNLAIHSSKRAGEILSGSAMAVETSRANREADMLQTRTLSSEKKKKLTFAEVYFEYMKLKMEPVLSKTYCESVHSRASTYLLPAIGEDNIEDITSPMILEAVRKIEKLGKKETAKRVLGLAYAVFKYAKACWYFTGQNPAADLSDALSARTVKRMASLTDLSEIGRLLYAASNYESFYLRYAIKIQAHTFVRASELRFAQWSEINFVKREWKIPAERMKMSSPHIVPMSTQVVESFRALKDVTGGTIHVFRSTRKSNEDIPFSEAAVLVAMKSCLNMIGLPENAMVGHGWRSVASTILNESGKFSSDVIERQLAHMERNRTRATYNYAQYIPVRIEMMQWYSNYLDSLETRERERSNAARDYLFYRFANKKK